MNARRVARVLPSLALALAIRAGVIRAQEAEPPPEAAPGDWSAELTDSLANGWVETTFATRGRAGSAPRSGERLRFRGEGVSGSVRGGSDPLAGTRLQAPLGEGTLYGGRLAPRWGRGLLLGGAAQPWSLQPEDRGEDAPVRGHAGDGALYRSEGGAGELLAARFGHVTLCGARAAAAGGSLGVLLGGRTAQASAAVETEGVAGELAMDARGRWRAEFSARRTVEPGSVALRGRGGLAGFRSLAEPARAGPARLLAGGGAWRGALVSSRANAALWTYAPGASGAAATLEVQRRLVHHAFVAVGFDEQHGPRRDPSLASVPVAASGLRQGWWCAWRGRAESGTLELRHELRGGRAFARQAVRRSLVARGEHALPRGATLSLTHSTWTTRAGETHYLTESDGDVLTLRAASGAGARTQAVLATPLLGGRARALAEWTTVPSRRTAPVWSLEWTRRSRQ